MSTASLVVEDLILEVVIPVSCESTAYGALVVLVIMAGFTLCCKGLQVKARLLLFSTLLLLFLSSTGLHTAKIIRYLAKVRKDPASDQRTMNQTLDVIIVLTRLNFLLTDAIVVWRAWVMTLCRRSRIGLAVCICTSTVTAIIDGALSIHESGSAGPQRLLLFIPLVVTNVFSTFVIICKTWYFRHHIKPHFRIQRRSTQIEKILILLVESGLLYFAFWVLAILTTLSEAIPRAGREVIAAIFPYISAIYPTVIILVVANDKAVEDSIGEIPSLSQGGDQSDPRQSRLSNRVSVIRPSHGLTPTDVECVFPGSEQYQMKDMNKNVDDRS